jgi:hypothetical protein
MMLFYDRLPKTDVSFFMQADFPAPFIEIFFPPSKKNKISEKSAIPPPRSG